ncbi:hypothetical protein CI109_101827 [Kwoniella shandongensis]|uniref:Uncharacterized protein n=1 Tax=Kwoniella shandongensis TaxID=1734106 RepID=A0A5M6C626_9TREE|nr:uncharacterized protein CI109_001051 [Kwoniella shandongensis]KAA5530251.1 hypothetical protein CI109_001051 [Kwoniella shandongensis]
MSLYSGIKFSASELQAQADAKTASDRNQASTSTSISTSSSTSETKPSSSGPSASAPKAAAGYSAALKFAPRIPKPKPTTSNARPAGFVPAPLTSIGNGLASASSSVDIVRSAEPILNVQQEKEIQFGPDGLPLAKAPAMTLAAGQKGKFGKRDRGAGDGQKKKKKKKKKIQQPLMPTFDPDEQYDPNRPNDLGEYQQYRKRLREERRAKLLEERRRKAEGLGGSSDESSYYTDSEEDVAPRRDAPKMFAPPKMYSPPSAARRDLPREEPSSRPPPPPPSTQSSLNDDPYARRAAMTQVSTGDDDAFARRAALSAPIQPPSANSGDEAYARRAALSGDEAYARRLALSQGQGAPSFAPPTASIPGFGAPPPPSFAPPPPPNFASAPRPPPNFAPPPPSALSGAPPPPPPQLQHLSVADIPGFGLSTPAPTSGSSTVVPAQAPAAPGSEDFAKMLEERKKAAEAIAAKFKLLAGGGAGASSAPVLAPPVEPQDDAGGGTFAEKMMRKWGHKEGTGLGAHGTGIVHALAAEHIQAAPRPVDPNQPLSKRALAKQKAAAANAKNRKWVQAPNARGRIVNANEDERQREEKGRLGEASRVICLVGLVDGVEEVDEELSDEIGEECSKWGIVERVVLHMVEPPPPEPSECLRVFIVFSGMAGAWRATRELDGRFFGGKKIRATYFDEARFDAGDRDGEII